MSTTSAKPATGSTGRPTPAWRLWLLRVILPALAVVMAAEGAMRWAESRFEDSPINLGVGDVPVLKIRAARDELADGGTLYLGASDTESALMPAQIQEVVGDDRPGYNASIAAMPIDSFDTWARELDRVGARPDRIVVGVGAVQFFDLSGPLSIEFPEGPYRSVGQAVQVVRDNLLVAARYAGLPPAPTDRLALVRSRQRFHHPADALNTLTGDPSELSPDAQFLRSDGTSSQWDETIEVDYELSPLDPKVLGPIDTDKISAFAQDMAAIVGRADTQLYVVMLPLSQENTTLRDVAEYPSIAQSLSAQLCDRQIPLLNLSELEIGPDQFALGEHFNRRGAEVISDEVGQWLAGGPDCA